MLNRLIPAREASDITHPTTEKPGFDLREGVGFLWRQWIFITSIVGVVLFVALVYLYSATPRYTATAQVLLETQQEKAGKEDAILSQSTFDFEMFASQLAIIKSTVFLQRVVERAGLISEPEFGSPQQAQQSPQSSSVFARIGSIFRNSSASSAPQNVANSSRVKSAVEALRGAILASRVGQAYVLAISVTSIDPTRAAKIANAVADGYVVEKLDARFEAAKRASAWLSDRLAELRGQLRNSEEAVAQFRSEHGFVANGANVTLTQQQLSELNANVLAARSDVAQKKARVELVRSIVEKGGSLQSLPDFPTSPVLASLNQQVATISQKVDDLVRHYDERHPLVVNAHGELIDAQRAVVEETKRVSEKFAASVASEYELAKVRLASLEASLREATGQSSLDDKTAITLRELERTAAVNKSLFEDFLQRAKITQEQSTFDTHEARVITPAMPPGSPSYPKGFQVMILALVFGLFIAVGSAIAKDLLNGGFATPRQIEDMLRVPLLSSVNVMRANDLKVKGSVVQLPLYPAAMPLSRFSESIRLLRSGIQMSDVDSPPKLIQVTSTVPNEGKTTLALSLAVSAAASGLKVLFIDTDLRHNSGSSFLGLLKSKGLVDLLLGGVSAQDVITHHKQTNFWVLPAGSKTRNPGDLLSSARMKTLLENCRNMFDLVVMDSPPVGPVVDPIVIAQLADTIVYVIRWASTARELVHQSMQRLPGDKIAGVVFNQVNEKAAQKYGKYAYQYYYGARSFKKYYEG